MPRILVMLSALSIMSGCSLLTTQSMNPKLKVRSSPPALNWTELPYKKGLILCLNEEEMMRLVTYTHKNEDISVLRIAHTLKIVKTTLSCMGISVIKSDNSVIKSGISVCFMPRTRVNLSLTGESISHGKQ